MNKTIIIDTASSLWERRFEGALALLQERVEQATGNYSLVPFFDGERILALAHDQDGWACQWYVAEDKQYVRFQTVTALEQWWTGQQEEDG